MVRWYACARPTTRYLPSSTRAGIEKDAPRIWGFPNFQERMYGQPEGTGRPPVRSPLGVHPHILLDRKALDSMVPFVGWIRRHANKHWLGCSWIGSGQQRPSQLSCLRGSSRSPSQQMTGLHWPPLTRGASSPPNAPVLYTNRKNDDTFFNFYLIYYMLTNFTHNLTWFVGSLLAGHAQGYAPLSRAPPLQVSPPEQGLPGPPREQPYLPWTSRCSW